MWKKIVTISLAIVMVLSLAACTKGDGELPSSQEIVNEVIESLDDIRTYQFDMDMTMDVAGEAEGEAFEVTVIMDSSGAVDVENRQMSMDATQSLSMLGQPEMEMGMEMCIVGDMIYMLTEMPEMEAMWAKSQLPEEYWGEVSQVEYQTELLEAAQVEVLGSEMVEGIDCYVLQLTPDLEQLWQFYVQQAQVTGEVPEELLQEIFQSFSVKQWIAKDTYFLTNAGIDMVMELTPEDMGYPEEEGVMTLDITMSFWGYDYNQPVFIELPPGAEEAVEMPM
ncbi:MAG TPA: hypothetical protein G4N93_00235 [Dehalococcoidia bacterium]|nr:hypothetical protein [Dehalococcoidia bacterium]